MLVSEVQMCHHIPYVTLNFWLNIWEFKSPPHPIFFLTEGNNSRRSQNTLIDPNFWKISLPRACPQNPLHCLCPPPSPWNWRSCLTIVPKAYLAKSGIYILHFRSNNPKQWSTPTSKNNISTNNKINREIKQQHTTFCQLVLLSQRSFISVSVFACCWQVCLAWKTISC